MKTVGIRRPYQGLVSVLPYRQFRFAPLPALFHRAFRALSSAGGATD
jgi:hypothetical protein